MSNYVMCVNSGKIYNTAQDAADDTGVSKSGISLVLSGKRAGCNGYIYIYVPADQSSGDYQQIRAAALADLLKITNLNGCRIELPDQYSGDAAADLYL